MCRLFICNAKALNVIGIDALEQHMLLEEKMFGGDGMGVASMSPRKSKQFVWGKKSMHMTAVDASNLLYWRKNMGDVFFIWHTRQCSAGQVCDSETQPFWSQTEGKALAHNGTVRELVSHEHPRYSDTHIMAALYFSDLWGWGDFAFKSSVFVGFDRGKPFITKYKHAGDLAIVRYSDGGWIAASDATEHIQRNAETVYVADKKAKYQWIWSKEIQRPPKPPAPEVPSIYTTVDDTLYTYNKPSGVTGTWESYDEWWSDRLEQQRKNGENK